MTSVLVFLPSIIKPNLVLDASGHALPFSQQHERLDTLKTEKQYLAALGAADETTFKNEFETEFLLLLDKQQREAYDGLATLEARKAYIENYWKAANPNPLLPENDWLLDVLKRRAYARENFPAPEPPYFDDRGKYYLKYGKPSFRYWESGSPDSVYPNETWSYENVTRNLLVHFVKDGPTFRETDNPLSFYIGGKFRSPEIHPEQWSRIAAQRAAVSPVFGRAYAKIQELAAARAHAAAFPNSHTILGIELRQPQTILHAIYEQATVEVLRAKRESPVAAHDEIHAVNKLQFTHDLAQFRGPNGATRLEISLLSPLHKNLLIPCFVTLKFTI
ncbi:MAG: GWxTD domain-containing protein [candidate division KSB1 bacterium]|nr:GWxTD domain-containing protein [candidate division KSB1 bacterium]MDZ7368749.1 GWxTD domain-containing protein [candidate division KSB1 bacterium]